jgi:hypothetical protein
MAEIINKNQSIQAIKQLLADSKSDSSILNSLDISKPEIDRRQNSINAVVNLLKNFLNPQAAALVQQAASTSTQASSVTITGIGTQADTKYVPSFNVRTPIVKLELNGTQIYPNKKVLGTDKYENSKLNFQSLNLSYPFGGVEKSVTGSVSIFTKNPEEIFTYMNSWDSKELAAKSVDGFPTLTIEFGWAFSDSTYLGGDVQVNTVSAVSPKLRFLITNVQMTDPGTAGTTFTFSLQELGTVVLKNSSDSLIIASDYPQQQLRTLLEGILHLRLFTLDDLLNAGSRNVESNVGKGALLTNEDLTQLLKDRNQAGFSTYENQTFFTNTKGPAISINNRNFLTIANELASQCRCKWYPHSNDPNDVNKDSIESKEALSRLMKLGNDLKQVKQLTGNSIPAGLSTSLIDIYKDNIPMMQSLSDYTSRGKEDTRIFLEALMRHELAKLYARSRLFWVSNVPSDWNTTGSKFFASAKNKHDNSLTDVGAYEEGAFFLLPELLDDYDIFTQDLPVQYGPGASAMPYFYGSGQNVFQASLGSKEPAMFGEVLALSATHSNLIAIMAQSANETLTYAVDGKRLNVLEDINKFASAKQPIPRVTPDERITKEQMDKNAALIQKQIAEKRATFNSVKDRFKSARFKGALALGTGNLNIFDDDSMTDVNKSRFNTDPPVSLNTGAAETASLKVKTRVSNFLRYPTAAKITILGDPNLLRLGPGCFELFSYYPVEHEDGSVTQAMNTLTSGVYFVKTIEHSISGGEFITTLDGVKIEDPMNVPSSITNKIAKRIKESPDTNKQDNNATSKELEKQISAEFLDINLNSDDFTRGFLAKELQDVLSRYKRQTNK